MAVDPTLRSELQALGWLVRSVPIPAGDLAGFGVGIPAQAADLVLVDHALTPLHHADKRAALSRVAHWLRPGGLLVLHEPLGRAERPAWWRRRLVAGLGHSGPVPVEFWTTACEHAGFEAPSPLGRAPEVVLLVAVRRAIAGG